MSQSQLQSNLPSTKPSSYSDYAHISSQHPPDDDIWGVLVPLQLKKYDTCVLTEDVVSFGRLPDNTFMFSRERHNLQQKVFDNISKTHFVIKRDDNSSKVTITDKSMNGTYVNGQKIPTDKPFPLPHLSVVSMSVTKNKVFQFYNRTQLKLLFASAPSDFFKKYTLEDEILGKGGYATVKKGFKNQDYRDKVAVKIVDKDNIRNRCGSERDFSYEVNIVKDLDHENIVKIRDYFENDHFIYIVMELASEGSLLGYMRKRRSGVISEPLCKDFFKQILMGVKFLHENNIIHRDIKADNILLHRNPDVSFVAKITDFGASRHLSPQSQCLSPVGTEHYWAPEVNSGFGYTKQADLWSLGCLLFVMLFGQTPYKQKPNHAVIESLMDDARLANKPLVKDLLSGFLKMDPEQRLSIQEAIHHDWFHQQESVENPSKRQRVK
ncbi:serine/threonine-protein kinase Chk2-like [Clytia hemisphaerica]|uniref:Uncharacterized protein n=1 Tax=Clytia hemisphaerica TaxID=252671 RepID=A0A7M5TWW6_9CNID